MEAEYLLNKIKQIENEKIKASTWPTSATQQELQARETEDVSPVLDELVKQGFIIVGHTRNGRYVRRLK